MSANLENSAVATGLEKVSFPSSSKERQCQRMLKVKVKSLSRVRLLATPWTVAYQAPLSMRFSRQEYWSGLPFPSPGDLPDPGIEPGFPTLEADTLTSEPPGKPNLHSICQQIWKTQQWPQDWKRSVFVLIPKKGNANECSNYCTIALSSHVSKVVLKILQVRLQQYMNRELPDIQAGFSKGRGTRDQMPTSAGSSKKQESSRKTSISALLTMPKPLTVDHKKLENSERDGNTRPPGLHLEKSVSRSGRNT